MYTNGLEQSCRTSLALFGLLLVGGCANFAVHPPTPARQIDFSGLKHSLAGERFYVIVFGSESTPRIPRLTHSWAAFIRVAEQGNGRQTIIDCHTISWMPATLQIHPWRFSVEEGTNLGLHESLQWALATNQAIAQFGPCECRPELYYRSIVQKEFLQSQMGYQAIDTVGEAGRTGRGCNCIHAITDMDPVYTRARYRLIRFGIAASRFVANELARRDMLINPGQAHDWLNERLRLESYPMIRRRISLRGMEERLLLNETEHGT
jgi:hypothetical protein